MKSQQEEDPLRKLSKKALRRLARKYKIKHFYRKSPSSLRRAIRRLRQRDAETQHPTSIAELQPQSSKANTPSKITDSKKPLTAEERAEQREKETLKAYEEHRLRYLYAPSRFVHKGTHKEYILEKDEEIELPEFYREDELVAMPIDPFRFYVYWDFAEETLYDVRSWLAEDTPFLLRVHDVTSLVFDGSNAHYSWEMRCHPLSREWYIDTPISGRNVIVELGVLLSEGFRSILRSNSIYIPPESVSVVKHDIFAQFVPIQMRQTDRLRPVVNPTTPPRVVPKPETSAHAFFQEYQPSPVKYHPPPPPQIVRGTELSPPPIRPLEELFPPIQPQAEPGPGPRTEPFHITLPDTGGWQPPQTIVPAAQQPTVQTAQYVQETQMEAQGGQELSEGELREYLQDGGQERLQEWLGTPREIRWLSDLPIGMSPIFFEHWITDPYDRAVMISYSIWPWELTEYIPLGASDWTLRKFLGASLFSWYSPGGSERLRWWQRPLGASELKEWLQPQGASERTWSGSWQADQQPQQSAWYLWPLNQSGKGLFG